MRTNKPLRVEPTMPEVIDGSFECEACLESVDQAEYYRSTQVIIWTCENGHKTALKDFKLQEDRIISEYQESRRDGAKLVKNSGRSTSTNKGDAILDKVILVDYKEGKKSFTLNKEVWAKLRTDAVKQGNLEPTLKVVLGEQNEPKLRLFIVEEDLFWEMKDAWLQKYNTEPADMSGPAPGGN